jgi:NAD(P)-dependent dehydrogenase (short-subunit alcohol dehydrogenase family)
LKTLPHHFRFALGYHFLQRQFRSLGVPTTSYAGRTVIITGANGGLGLEAARHFARLGAARIILACRSTERGEAAKADIEQSATSSTVLEVWPLDLCSFDSVRAFCRRAEKELDRLDVLLANAALLSLDALKMAEGYEVQITANVISNFLMVLMLLPLMRRTASKWNTETTVSVVASEAHFFVSTLAVLFLYPLSVLIGFLYRPGFVNKTNRTSLSLSALGNLWKSATPPLSCLMSWSCRSSLSGSMPPAPVPAPSW